MSARKIRGSLRVRQMAMIMLVVAVVGLPLAGLGASFGRGAGSDSTAGLRADTSGNVTGDARLHTMGAVSLGGGLSILSGKITDHGDLAIPVTQTLTGADVLSDGGLLFGNQIVLYLYNLQAFNQSLHVTVYQHVNSLGVNGTKLLSTTMTATALGVSEINVNFPDNIPQTRENLTVDGASWVFFHLTPYSLLPNLITTVGGVDLLVIGILVIVLVLVCPLIMIGRWLSHKALHAPNFNLLIWGHVIVIGLLTLLFFDYQTLDSLFGGLSYYLYPVVIAVMIGLWSMHLFNKSQIIEILKPDTMSGHRLRYLRWTQLIGTLADGRVVIIDPRWRGFIYALLGHFTTLIPVESEATVEGRPAGADIENRETLAAHELRKIDQHMARRRPGKEKPEDDFQIINAVDSGDPVRLFWVDSDEPVVVEFSHTSWRKEVDVPEMVDKHGVHVAAHKEQKLTWPHIVDGESSIRLAGIHYFDAPLAALGWSTAEDDFALLEKRAYAVYVLRSRLHSETNRLTEERLSEFLMLLESGNTPLTEQEAQEMSERRPYDPRDRMGGFGMPDDRTVTEADRRRLRFNR